MLQSMRSSAKYIWIFLIVFFVGGFLLAETSGLLGVGQITPSTAVAEVNGEDILATSWYNAMNAMEQQAIQQTGRDLDVAIEGSGWIAVQTADGAVRHDAAFPRAWLGDSYDFRTSSRRKAAATSAWFLLQSGGAAPRCGMRPHSGEELELR